jgi:hypothetical protein
VRTLAGPLLAVLLIAATSDSPDATSAPQIQTGVSRIVLATIVDGSGRTMVDFEVDDFVVSEGGRGRELLDVHVADYPIVVLLDDSTDSARWETIRSVAGRFINRIGERPIALGLLTRGPALTTTFDHDRAATLERLSALTANPAAPRFALPLAAAATEALRALEAPFSAVVIIAASPLNDPSPAAGELLPSILASGAPIHVVEGQAQQRTPEAGAPDLLKLLAEQSRGQFTTIFAPSSYAVALDRLADRMSAEMMIEFLVPPGAGGGDVQVGVRRPGARVVGLGVSR